jgi:hypothetical protein
LSSFYSIFLKEVDADVRDYLTVNQIDMQGRSLSNTLTGTEDHDYMLDDGFLTNAKFDEINEILDVLMGVEE